MSDVGRAKWGLGRGLDALIPASSGGVGEVAVEQIDPNPRQPRGRIDSADLRELADSIREHGLLQPVIVTRLAGYPGHGDDPGPPPENRGTRAGSIC